MYTSYLEHLTIARVSLVRICCQHLDVLILPLEEQAEYSEGDQTTYNEDDDHHAGEQRKAGKIG